MTIHKTPETRSPEDYRPAPSGWRSSVEWAMGIIGAIGVFLGLFISFAGDDQYVGLGGDLSWRVGEISSAWAYGFLIGGAALMVGTIGLILQGRSRR